MALMTLGALGKTAGLGQMAGLGKTITVDRYEFNGEGVEPGDILCYEGESVCYDTGTGKYQPSNASVDVEPSANRGDVESQVEAIVNPKTRIAVATVEYPPTPSGPGTPDRRQERFCEDFSCLAVGVTGGAYTLIPMTPAQAADYRSRIDPSTIRYEDAKIDLTGRVDNPGSFQAAYEQVRSTAQSEAAQAAQTTQAVQTTQAAQSVQTPVTITPEAGSTVASTSLSSMLSGLGVDKLPTWVWVAVAAGALWAFSGGSAGRR